MSFCAMTSIETGRVINFLLPATTVADPMVNLPCVVASSEYDHDWLLLTAPLMTIVLDPIEGPPTTLKLSKDGGRKSNPLALRSSNWTSKTECCAIFDADTLVLNSGSCANATLIVPDRMRKRKKYRSVLKFPFLTGCGWTWFFSCRLWRRFCSGCCQHHDFNRIDSQFLLTGLISSCWYDQRACFHGHQGKGIGLVWTHLSVLVHKTGWGIGATDHRQFTHIRHVEFSLSILYGIGHLHHFSDGDGVWTDLHFHHRLLSKCRDRKP